MSSGIDKNATIDIPCENCGRKTAKSLRWLETNNEFTCACGTVINVDGKQFVRDLEKTLNDGVKSLQKTIDTWNRARGH